MRSCEPSVVRWRLIASFARVIAVDRRFDQRKQFGIRHFPPVRKEMVQVSAADIRLDHRYRLIEGESHDGAGSIRADSRKAFKFRPGLGQRSPEPLRHRLRAALQVQGTPVIAQTLPHAQQFRLLAFRAREPLPQPLQIENIFGQSQIIEGELSCFSDHPVGAARFCRHRLNLAHEPPVVVQKSKRRRDVSLYQTIFDEQLARSFSIDRSPRNRPP